MDEDTSGHPATINADLALDLKIIASIILFGGHYAGEFPLHDSFVQALTEWATEHPFQLTPYAEPVTSSALIFMIASRFGDQSTLELPIRFFESVDIMATQHISPDIYLRCSRLDTLIANQQWVARHGPIMSWMAIHRMLNTLRENQDSYPPHSAASAFRRTMQLVALQILILLAFKDFRIRKVLTRLKFEMFNEERNIENSRDRVLTNLVQAAARSDADVGSLRKFHGKLLEYLRCQDHYQLISRI